MGFWARLLGRSKKETTAGPIVHVALFVTDAGMSRIISRGPGLRSRPQPPGFLPEADAWFDLHGALVEYFKGRPVDFANAPDFDDWEWDQYLKRLFPDRLCARWQKRTPTAIYTVVLVRASC